jgi:hypothetical protein
LEFYDLVCKSSLRSGVANVREPTDRRHYWQLMLSAKAGEVWCFYSPYLVSMSEWCMIEPSGGVCHPRFKHGIKQKSRPAPNPLRISESVFMHKQYIVSMHTRTAIC